MAISLVTFNDKTVTPQDDALVYESALHKSGIIYGCTVTLASANVLHVASGHGVIAGRKFTVDAMDITVPLSSSGTIKGRLYIHLELSNTSEPIKIQVQTASTLTPPVQNANVNLTSGIWEFNLCEFSVSTTTISNIKMVAPTMHAIAKTLTAGQTTLTFDNLPTYGNYLISIYTSTGVVYSRINLSVAGQLTLTFSAQPTDIVVYCKLEEA